MIYIKESRFNRYFTASDGARLAFNSLSCGLAIVDETYLQLQSMLPGIDETSLTPQQFETYQAAIKGNFFVPDDFDELLDYATKRNIQKYGMDSLGLTIAPTLLCNFSCVYCYETSKPGTMSAETQKNLLNFVEAQASHLKRFEVTWYGGEPLLAVDVIRGLSEKFQEICVKYGLEYEAFMISNGSLFHEDIIQMMQKYQIRGVQITIDGPKAVHDSRRISKNGESTFDCIIGNINRLLSSGIEVVLRINVDKENDQTVDELIEYLEHNLASRNIKITFGQVTAYTAACSSIESSCYNNGEFAKQLIKYYEMLKNHGFQKYNPFPYPEAKLNYCCAELLSSFVVDQEGYLYKCWNLVGETEKAVGNINDPSFDISGYKNGGWVARDPLSFDGCRECLLLPLCVGGCPYTASIKEGQSGCDLIKYNIEDVMLTYYNYAKEGLL